MQERGYSSRNLLCADTAAQSTTLFVDCDGTQACRSEAHSVECKKYIELQQDDYADFIQTYASQATDISYIAFMLVDNMDDPGNTGIDGCIELSDEFKRWGEAVGWDYFDGACAILVGIQLLREGKYKQGAAAIGSGTFMLLSAHSWWDKWYVFAGGSVILAPISFAVAMAVDVVSTIIEYREAAAEADLHSWCQLKVEEVNSINQKLETSSDDEKLKLAAKKHDILLELGCRYRFNKNSDYLDQLNSIDQTALNLGQATSYDEYIDKKIRAKADEKFQMVKFNLPFKFLSFVGMSFTAAASVALLFGLAAPPLWPAIAGAVICSVVAGYYLTRLAVKLNNYKKNKEEENQFTQKKAECFRFFKSVERGDAVTSAQAVLPTLVSVASL